MKSKVCILEIAFVSDVEYYDDLIERVRSKINRPVYDGKWSRTSASLIVETEEHPEALLGRVFEIIDKDDVDNAWAYEVVNAVSLDAIRHGPRWCNFTNTVKASLVSVRQRSQSKDVKPRQFAAKPFAISGSGESKKSAAVQVTRKRSRLRKSAG